MIKKQDFTMRKDISVYSQKDRILIDKEELICKKSGNQ